MCFFKKCVLRHESLPILPCDCTECDWYIDREIYNNCFWLLAETLNSHQYLSYEEISDIMGLSEESVEEIFNKALSKIRSKLSHMLDNTLLTDDS